MSSNKVSAYIKILNSRSLLIGQSELASPSGDGHLTSSGSDRRVIIIGTGAG